MCDTARQLAADLERVCLFALTCGMTAARRRDIEAVLERARAALNDADPAGELRDFCRENGIVVDGDLVDRDGAARIAGMTRGALDNRRCSGLDPDYVRRGRRVFYRLSDLREFIRVHPVARRDMGP